MVYLHVMNLEWVKFDTGNNAHQITISNVFSKKKKERKKKKMHLMMISFLPRIC